MGPSHRPGPDEGGQSSDHWSWPPERHAEEILTLVLYLQPEHGMFSQTPHSTVKTMSGVSTVLGLPTKVFSEDDVSVFASGGLDHTVRLWHVDEDDHASSEELHSVSKSRVESLLYCTKDNILFSAGGARSASNSPSPGESFD